MKRVLAIAILCALCGTSLSTSAGWVLRGVVRDSLTLAPLPAASIVGLPGAGGSTMTHEDGLFEMRVPEEVERLSVTLMGYRKKEVPIGKTALNMVAIDLSPETIELPELEVKKRKERYTKHNNPAVELMRRVRDSARVRDPLKQPHYGYDKYEKITLALNNFAPYEEDSWMFQKFPFLWQHVDTSDVSGQPILNFLIKEKVSEKYHDKERGDREWIAAFRQEGLDDIADPESMRTFLEDVFREVDIYEDNVNILQNRFVSPLSRIAADFYKFYLTDTVDIDAEQCAVLTFVPRNPATFGFVGQLYVPLADSARTIRQVSLRIPRDINLNFITDMQLYQAYSTAPNGSRLKTEDDFVAEMSLLPGAKGIYARRNTKYTNHTFDSAAINRPHPQLWEGLGNILVDPLAESRDSAFWASARQGRLPHGESTVGELMGELRRVPIYYWGEKAMKLMFTGYVPTRRRDSKFDFGPLNTLVSHDYLQGWRFRAGGVTTAQLSKRWFGRGYVAWSTRGEHRWKYSAEVEYSFRDKKQHSREFPIQAIRLTHRYDVDQLGQHYLFTNMDNFFLTIKRRKDLMLTYQRLTRLQWICELQNHLSFEIGLSHQQQQAGPYTPFITQDGRSASHYQTTTATFEIRYAPEEKFYQTRTYRIPVNMDAPVVLLSHTVGPGGCLGSEFTVNRTELSLQKRIWFSAFGYLDGIVKGSHIWSTVPYPDLLSPNTNLSYTIQPESFALLNPLEFINDSQVEWDLAYWANGTIFNYIPGLKKLRLREVVAFRGVWGRLSQRNDPTENGGRTYLFPIEAMTHKMNHGPYMEASVGIDNLFKCLRVDWVWRLNYLDQPGITRNGPRIALHMTF